jgi:CRISPR system Cascade subunit CasE
MYFSLITPAPGQEHAAVHQRLESAYADHQWLWHWFPAEAGSARDFIFRRCEDASLPRFYVVSQRPPSASRAGWLAQTRHYAPQLVAGDSLGFELRANPTVRHGRSGATQRHDVVMEAKHLLLRERGLARWSDWQDDDRPEHQDLVRDACLKWLQRQGAARGFAIEAESVVVDAYQQHREKAGGELCFSTVDFHGDLRVTDPAALQAALWAGIGRAKAFGCGLMLVRRLG